jgi:ubiquinone/menaquinone biosynthesis C-methylase UbiE
MLIPIATTPMASLYDLIEWAYYAARARRPPDPARYVLTNSDWVLARATVLDYGGGDGRWAVELAERAARVVVADIDEDALHRVPVHPRVTSVLLDGVRLPFRSGAFDAVFVNHVFHHIEDLPSVLSELERVLRPAGRLVIIEFHPRACVTRVYRLLSRYRDHPCTFYAPRDLARHLQRRAFSVEHRQLDEFQFVIAASVPRFDLVRPAPQPS